MNHILYHHGIKGQKWGIHRFLDEKKNKSKKRVKKSIKKEATKRGKAALDIMLTGKVHKDSSDIEAELQSRGKAAVSHLLFGEQLKVSDIIN